VQDRVSSPAKDRRSANCATQPCNDEPMIRSQLQQLYSGSLSVEILYKIRCLLTRLNTANSAFHTCGVGK